jgi:polyhydroxyalkanoate synthesis repressor PhaR
VVQQPQHVAVQHPIVLLVQHLSHLDSVMDQATAKPASGTTPVVIKKYANRRLYNTDSSSYITLDHLAKMTRDGRDFQVFDAKSGDDITRSVLTQIVMDEEENGGQTMLPIPFLRQLIAMYGGTAQSMVPHYLEASMDAFSKNQAQFRETMSNFGGGALAATALKPFEAMAKQNMAMFAAATSMLNPRAAAAAAPAPAATKKAEPDELAELKAQMAALQAQLDRLGK